MERRMCGKRRPVVGPCGRRPGSSREVASLGRSGEEKPNGGLQSLGLSHFLLLLSLLC